MKYIPHRGQMLMKGTLEITSNLFQFVVIGMKKLVREAIEKFPISSANYAEVLRERKKRTVFFFRKSFATHYT